MTRSAGPDLVIQGRDVPQATSLPRVREAVAAIVDGAKSASDVADAMGLVERLTRYYIDAARTLGWITGEDGEYAATRTGGWLVETPKGSRSERQAFTEGIQQAVVIRSVAPKLLSPTAPAAEVITERIMQFSGLQRTTARRRAQAMLAWRRHATLQGSSGERLQNLLLFPEDAATPPVTAQRARTSAGSTPETAEGTPRITGLRLIRFKGFEEAEVALGRFTMLLGTNASGKSNVRDALRFLHGIGRGYAISEIIGEKWAEGGVLQWKGIRGGVREVTYVGKPTFRIEVELEFPDGERVRAGRYEIEVEVAPAGDGTLRAPRVIAERLVVTGRGQYVFDSHPAKNVPEQLDHVHLSVRLKKKAKSGFIGPALNLLSSRPALSQLVDNTEASADVRRHVASVLAAFRSMRFLDLAPDALRLPSVPGQIVLGDRGENLSSVLLAICELPSKKRALVEWIRELTPLDVVDLEFVPDAQGKILVTLVEHDQTRTSAYSASDGTLRFLAMLAAFLGPQPAHLFFFEELETGLHPARLTLLLNLIDQQTRHRHLQVVASTHSPQLLAALDSETVQHAALTFRRSGRSDQEIKPILALPRVAEVLKRQDLARLHASGFLEDAIALDMRDDESDNEGEDHEGSNEIDGDEGGEAS